MPESYRIIDEPSPGTLTRFTVHPMFPMLAVMLGGVGIGWPWFVLNALALGSATRRREGVAMAVGLAGLAALTLALAGTWLPELIGPGMVKYARVLATTWVLGVSYVVFQMQNDSFQIYEYMGGHVGNGAAGVVMAAVLGSRLAAQGPFLAAIFW